MMTFRSSRSARTRSSLLGLFFWLGLVLSLSLSPRGARADTAEPTGSFKEHYERAVVLYNSGQYDKAIGEFQAAYEQRPRPLLLFNLGQAHRKAGHPQQALDLYERFLRDEPSTDLRGETQGYIDEVKGEIERQNRPAPAVQTGEPAPRPLLARPQPAPVAPPPSPAPPGPRRPLRLAKWLLGGAGLLAIAAGATLWALDGHPTCSLAAGQVLCPQQLDTQTAGIVTLTGGLLAVGGSAVMFVFDARQQARDLRDQGDPKDAQRTAMLWLSGRF